MLRFAQSSGQPYTMLRDETTNNGSTWTSISIQPSSAQSPRIHSANGPR
jgi:hypothetical protein